jgi:hypothetical protein
VSSRRSGGWAYRRRGWTWPPGECA